MQACQHHNRKSSNMRSSMLFFCSVRTRTVCRVTLANVSGLLKYRCLCSWLILANNYDNVGFNDRGEGKQSGKKHKTDITLYIVSLPNVNKGQISSLRRALALKHPGPVIA